MNIRNPIHAVEMHSIDFFFHFVFVFYAKKSNKTGIHVVGCSGSLSTTFQSYRGGVWLRQGAQCSLL